MDFGRGGAEKVAASLSNYLCEQGNEVHVLTIDNKDQLSERLNTEVRLTTFSCTTHIQTIIGYPGF